MSLWIVMERWPGAKEWNPAHVEKTLVAASLWMEKRYAGTVWERRVQPVTVKR